jgi:L-ascorbate metabolism protein UlaG (beta-lactamase superfamily)
MFRAHFATFAALAAALAAFAACVPPLPEAPAAPAPAALVPPPPPPPRAPPAAGGEPLALTYFGVAGWEIEGAGKIVLADPYFSRPRDANAPLVPDAAAIAAHAPPRADVVLVGHSHYDHLLDASAVALRTGAQLLGSVSTTRVGKASGVPDDHLITVKGGEDFEMGGYSIRAIPSLHSAIGDKHIFGGEIAPAPQLPMSQAGYQEGGTFAYLVRLGGRQVLVLDTANFIERELAGVHPDIAIIAPGLRGEIHDYTCRLLRVLGAPPIVIATHFDAWQEAPVDEPPDEDLQAFVAEVHACAPATRVILPHHFERMSL